MNTSHILSHHLNEHLNARDFSKIIKINENKNKKLMQQITVHVFMPHYVHVHVHVYAHHIINTHLTLIPV